MTGTIHKRLLAELAAYYKQAQKDLGAAPPRKQVLLAYHPDKLPLRIKAILTRNAFLNTIVGQMFNSLTKNPRDNIDRMLESLVKETKASLRSPSSLTFTPPPRPMPRMPSQKSVKTPHSQTPRQSQSQSQQSSRSGTKDTPVCIRRVANITQVKPSMLIDSDTFDDVAIAYLQLHLPKSSPKIMALIEKIQALDVKDLKESKKVYKHMIFTDVASSNYGAKLIVSALAAFGFHAAFTNKLTLKNDDKLLETKGANFGLMMSKPYGGKSMTVAVKKAMMGKFNSRDGNVYGDLMRLIVLDQGFKEGIDLFDVKYVHLFEPLVSKADEKQAIGRGTRYCGQKGLVFHPKAGWPLHVFKYDVEFSHPIQGAKTLFELFMKYSNIDVRRVTFATQLEQATIESAVDKELTQEIHKFDVATAPVTTPVKSASPSKSQAHAVPPPKIMGLTKMREYINTNFRKFKYPNAKLENKCVDPPEKSGSYSRFIDFTPTQDFLRHFFQPSSAYKGMLAFHSVGTGKLCAGIATATTSFEKEGYTILWVTRHTLKPDVWKNMYDQICSMTIREKIESGDLKLPKRVTSPKKYLSDNWIEPISFKQFTNMLSQSNKYYQQLVSRNGVEDPLRKTLIVIDEAHKLYAPNVAASEKPDTTVLEQWIHNSYAKSGKDSARVLLMTATPYTQDGLEMVSLLNLLRPDPFPTEFDEFQEEYLNDDGSFSNSGLTKYQNAVSGYISYLNRAGDARYFAYPIVEDIYVQMTESTGSEPDKHLDTELALLVALLKELRERKKVLKAAMPKKANKEQQKACQDQAKAAFTEASTIAKEHKEQALLKCKQKQPSQRKECATTARTKYVDATAKLRDALAKAKEKCKEVADQPTTARRNAQAELEELERQYAEHQQARDKIKEQFKEAAMVQKAIAAEIGELRALVKNGRNDLKVFATKLKKLAAKVKASGKSEAAVTLKAELKALRYERNVLRDEVKKTRGHVASLLMRKQLNRVRIGRASLGDLSQATALSSKCGV